MRASQINSCAYCLDMHSKDARANGETEQRLYSLDAWRETQFSEDELVHLSLAVVAINGWNRLNIAARTVAGDYVAGRVTQLHAVTASGRARQAP